MVYLVYVATLLLGSFLFGMFLVGSSGLVFLLALFVTISSFVASCITVDGPDDVIFPLLLGVGGGCILLGIFAGGNFQIHVGRETKYTPIVEQIVQADQNWSMKKTDHMGKDVYIFKAKTGRIRTVKMFYKQIDLTALTATIIINKHGDEVKLEESWGSRDLFNALQARTNDKSTPQSRAKHQLFSVIKPQEKTPEPEQPYWRLPL